MSVLQSFVLEEYLRAVGDGRRKYSSHFATGANHKKSKVDVWVIPPIDCANVHLRNNRGELHMDILLNKSHKGVASLVVLRQE